VLKKIIAPVVIGGALLGGVATTGAANAATPTASTTAPSHAGKGSVKAWLRSHRKELRKAGLDISAKTIGVTPQALRDDLKAGNSIAGVATQHSVSPQTVINALVSAADSQVNQAVSAHKLTSTQASKIEAKIPGRVTKIVNHTF
jgi:urease alpha subunit